MSDELWNGPEPEEGELRKVALGHFGKTHTHTHTHRVRVRLNPDD